MMRTSPVSVQELRRKRGRQPMRHRGNTLRKYRVGFNIILEIGLNEINDCSLEGLSCGRSPYRVLGCRERQLMVSGSAQKKMKHGKPLMASTGISTCHHALNEQNIARVFGLLYIWDEH